jgi:ATP-binding cassette subfamily C protein CydD
MYMNKHMLVPRQMRATSPSMFWLADGVAAIAMAAALACSAATAGVKQDRQGFLLALTGLAGAAVLRAGFQVAASVGGQRDAVRAKQDWRSRAFGAAVTTPPGARTTLGEQVADVTDRIEDLDGYHARFLPLRFAAVATPLLIAGAAAVASWVAGMILLLTLIPFVLGMALAGSAASKAAARQLDVLGRLSGLFIDRVRALPLIVSFGAQARISRHLAGATREVAERTHAVLRVAFFSSAVLEFFAALSIALVAVYCGFSLLGLLPFPAPERLDLGRALFVLVLAPEFYLPMRRLAAAYHDKQIATAAIDRLVQLPTPPDQIEADQMALAWPPAILIEDLVIDYGERKVGPFTVTIAAGQMTALFGPTGSGKSSLLNALLGLAPIAQGRIFIDGVPLCRTGLQGQIAWAGQGTALLPGSIADNIRIAKPGASDAEIEEVARRAGLLALAMTREAGLATIIDFRGSGLSGGEKRRIGVARAMLRDAPLWLLDEPTADLDRVAATALISEIREASRGRTVLLITHDREAAKFADHRMGLL